MHHFRLKPLLVPGDTCHAAVTTLTPATPMVLHYHDFMEVFVNLGGEGCHHINGRKIRLGTGSLVFIRPFDRHGFTVEGGATMRLLNVAFFCSWFRHFQGLLPNQALLFRWLKGKTPPAVQLARGATEKLGHQGEDLILTKSPRHLGLARFCLDAFGYLENPTLSKDDLSAPPWLGQCVAAMDRPENLQKGIAYFQKLAGRSPEHLARLCRFHFGAPPTELLNQARIRHAKRRLLESDAKVIDVAFDSGFQNLGYFHRTFLRLSGLTPRYWRFKHRPITMTD